VAFELVFHASFLARLACEQGLMKEVENVKAMLSAFGRLHVKSN
jgi:hypothetical protein